jgi:hypothetical protein
LKAFPAMEVKEVGICQTLVYSYQTLGILSHKRKSVIAIAVRTPNFARNIKSAKIKEHVIFATTG